MLLARDGELHHDIVIVAVSRLQCQAISVLAYNPSIARFVSPDSIVPGASPGVGGAGGIAGARRDSIRLGFYLPGR